METTHDERCKVNYLHFHIIYAYMYMYVYSLSHALLSFFPSSLILGFQLSLSLYLSLPLPSQDSAIIDFYPNNFRVDLNGKKWAWQGVALLLFVDEQRLLESLSSVYSNLTPYEGESDRHMHGGAPNLKSYNQFRK